MINCAWKAQKIVDLDKIWVSTVFWQYANEMQECTCIHPLNSSNSITWGFSHSDRLSHTSIPLHFHKISLRIYEMLHIKISKLTGILYLRCSNNNTSFKRLEFALVIFGLIWERLCKRISISINCQEIHLHFNYMFTKINKEDFQSD